MIRKNNKHTSSFVNQFYSIQSPGRTSYQFGSARSYNYFGSQCSLPYICKAFCRVWMKWYRIDRSSNTIQETGNASADRKLPPLAVQGAAKKKNQWVPRQPTFKEVSYKLSWFMYYIIRKYIFNGPLNSMFEVSKIYKIVWFWDVCERVLPRIHLLILVLLKGKRVLILVSRNGPWAFIRKGALNRTNNPVIFCMCKF